MWPAVTEAARLFQVFATVAGTVFCARNKGKTSWETDATVWASTSFGSASGVLILAWFLTRMSVKRPYLASFAFITYLIAQFVVGFAAGTVLYDATLAISSANLASRFCISGLGGVAVLLGLVALQPAPSKDEETRPNVALVWCIVQMLLAGGWAGLGSVVTSPMDAVPSNKIVTFAKGAGWNIGDAQFVIWASSRVHALRNAGFSILIVTVAGSVASFLSCSLNYFRNVWPYCAALSMALSAMLMASLSPWTSVLAASRDSTRLKPFPAYTGNATDADAAFSKFAEDSLVDVDYWSTNESWWLMVFGLSFLHIAALGMYRLVG